MGLKQVCCFLGTVSQPKTVLKERYNNKFKHIKIKYHFITDRDQRGAVRLQYIIHIHR